MVRRRPADFAGGIANGAALHNPVLECHCGAASDARDGGIGRRQNASFRPQAGIFVSAFDLDILTRHMPARAWQMPQTQLVPTDARRIPALNRHVTMNGTTDD